MGPESVRPSSNGTRSTRDEIREQVIGYISAAFGLVAGLAWNDAIRALIEALVPFGTNTLIAKFLYAIAVTAVVVIIIRVLLRRFR